MALVTCLDCRTQVSSLASTCPQCGRPLDTSVDQLTHGIGHLPPGGPVVPANRPAFGVVGLAWVAVGILVVGVALLATRWLSLDIGGPNGLRFGDLHDAATSGDQSGASRLAVAYFSWLAWVLLGVTAIVSLLALLPATATTNVRAISA